MLDNVDFKTFIIGLIIFIFAGFGCVAMCYYCSRIRFRPPPRQNDPTQPLLPEGVIQSGQAPSFVTKSPVEGDEQV